MDDLMAELTKWGPTRDPWDEWAEVRARQELDDVHRHLREAAAEVYGRALTVAPASTGTFGGDAALDAISSWLDDLEPGEDATGWSWRAAAELRAVLDDFLERHRRWAPESATW